eukprot:TRINITY_DN7709_c0_g1_i1.p1 TRINITY_DN7709_c0_g1~~TRINITY_DN7709_c0_g1_i1.p1  ORF type:complete len:105 (+),score=23.19 TRINITY_DN7709_c0_g1_i1:42-317(+)
MGEIQKIKIRIVIDSDYERSQSLVISWLQNVVELPEYIPLFIQHGFVSMKMVERIVEISYLKEMGIGIHYNIKIILCHRLNYYKLMSSRMP